MSVYNEETGSFEEIVSSVKSFAKPSSTSTGTTLNKDWMELPASPSTLGNRTLATMRATMNSKNTRNYSILYDHERYAATWVAFNYCKAHRGSGTLSSWTQNPQVDDDYEVDVSSTYSASGYDRGHQIPNALRNGVSAMQKQTYYFTNSTPQYSSFNQNIWNALETAERNIIDNSSASATDTLYIVTGPVYQTVGGSETVSTITQAGKKVPVANYYFRAILKVRRNSAGTVTAASTIGFWMPHSTDIAEDDYADYACSVNEIEQKTGFDLFANLPDDLEETAETNANWSTFKSFSF